MCKQLFIIYADIDYMERQWMHLWHDMVHVFQNVSNSSITQRVQWRITPLTHIRKASWGGGISPFMTNLCFISIVIIRGVSHFLWQLKCGPLRFYDDWRTHSSTSSHVGYIWCLPYPCQPAIVQIPQGQIRSNKCDEIDLYPLVACWLVVVQCVPSITGIY